LHVGAILGKNIFGGIKYLRLYELKQLAQQIATRNDKHLDLKAINCPNRTEKDGI
jgi:hypothetical protein